MPSPPPADPTRPGEPVETLEVEREHLRSARASLRQMRERTRELDPQSTGNWVSAQYLETLLELRQEQLADLPDTPLFFGRLDYADAGPHDVSFGSDVAGEVFHIGRRHVADEQGQPLVIDWRAPVSVPFYRASAEEPMGVDLRRRFAFTGGELTGFEDEPLTGPGAGPPGQFSHILTAEIERPRVGPMRDIVATIQPDQDEIVRADLATSVCVQGAPGTGKTAVGLHRAAFLLYAHREQLRRQRLLVIGPNDAFLRYIGAVLPALGEVDAAQTTIDELLATGLGRRSTATGSAARTTEPVAVATLKGDARMAEVLRRAVWSRLREPDWALEVPRGSRRFRVPAYEVADTVAALRDRGSRYATGRDMLPQRLAHAVLLRMEADGDSPDDRVQGAVARSREVKAYIEQIWPAVKPQQVLFELLSRADQLARAADGVLTEEEQAVLRWPKAPRSTASAKWSGADAALLDELADLLERTPSLGHVVVDEAQDLSPMQLRAIGRRCTTGSVTVLGDLAQGTTPWASDSWAGALAHLGKPDAVVEELTLGFRVPGEVIDYAARLLPRIAPGLAPPRSLRSSPGHLVQLAVRPADLLSTLVERAGSLLSDRSGSVGLVVPAALVGRAAKALTDRGLTHAVTGDEDDATSRLDLVPAQLAKGLEFDHVILAEPADIVAGEPDLRTGLRRLYVCLTRAVTSLQIVHARPLPAELSE
jgi:DNA helicase IV